MESITQPIIETFPFILKFGPGILIPLACFAIVGILAQWSLYDKCKQPGIDCVIPVKNVITFLKIVGRPASHSLLVILPPPIIFVSLVYIDNAAIGYALAAAFGAMWVIFMVKVYIELCQSFGHYKLTDYIMVVLFNGFYVLHLGLSYSEKYKGPVYGKKKATEPKKNLKSQLA
ncbi:MAG: DUF5684 domain-containing protein [Salibacteraceae bacterium]